jgi:hypothetical protein
MQNTSGDNSWWATKALVKWAEEKNSGKHFVPTAAARKRSAARRRDPSANNAGLKGGKGGKRN